MDDVEDAADEVLVRRIRAGDEASACVLFRRYEPLLRGRARRRLLGGLKRKVGESDLLQETYLAAFEGLDGFEDRGPGSFRAWLERILEHKASDEVRRHLGTAKRSTNREVSHGLTGSHGPLGKDRTPSAAAASEEEHDAVTRAIDELSGDDRLILLLVHEQGKGFGEAGHLMNRSAEAARKLYGRVVLRLAKRLREHR